MSPLSLKLKKSLAAMMAVPSFVGEQFLARVERFALHLQINFDITTGCFDRSIAFALAMMH